MSVTTASGYPLALMGRNFAENINARLRATLPGTVRAASSLEGLQVMRRLCVFESSLFCAGSPTWRLTRDMLVLQIRNALTGGPYRWMTPVVAEVSTDPARPHLFSVLLTFYAAPLARPATPPPLTQDFEIPCECSTA